MRRAETWLKPSVNLFCEFEDFGGHEEILNLCDVILDLWCGVREEKRRDFFLIWFLKSLYFKLNLYELSFCWGGGHLKAEGCIFFLKKLFVVLIEHRMWLVQLPQVCLCSDLCLQGGVPPQPRAAHSCAVLGNKGYIFGGRVLVSVFNGNDIFMGDVYKKLVLWSIWTFK